MLLLYLLAGQPGIGRGSSQADKQSADSSPDANDEQWLSQVSTSHSWLGGVDGWVDSATDMGFESSWIWSLHNNCGQVVHTYYA